MTRGEKKSRNELKAIEQETRMKEQPKNKLTVIAKLLEYKRKT